MPDIRSRTTLPRRLATTAAALLLGGTLLPALAPQAAAATTADLFISEYVEGSSNNKALELFNGTTAPVDLASGQYNLQFFSNGATTAGLTINLSGTVAPGDVFVVAQSSANATILAQADQTNGSGWYNGDDAVVLRRGTTVLDAVGQVGVDPGSEWGTGLTSTADNTLRRNADVCAGDPDPADAFDPAAAWTGLATDAFDGLGAHATTGCTPGTPGGGPADPPPGPTKIGAVQGSGDASPLNNTTVTVEGVVTGDFQQSSQFRGFWLQDGGDGNAATSDGLFVFSSVPVAEGDLVRVRGRVSEFNGQTQVSPGATGSVEVLLSDADLPTPLALTIPLADAEASEGMLVTLPQDLTIIEYFNYDRYGEIVLGTTRQDIPTAVVEPGEAARALAAANLANRIILDDGVNAQNAHPARHPNGEEFTLTNIFRGGDTLSDVTGILDYRFDAWRLQPTVGASYTATNPRPDVPDVGGSLKVASFNVLNYFTTLDSRGANTAAEFERQEAKIVAALAELDADVVGLIEIENNGTALDTLVAALNAEVGAGTYAAVETGPFGTDEITVAQIYKPATVTPEGGFRFLNLGDLNRWPLLQGYTEKATGGRVQVTVNHFKSKGSACPGDTDTGDGQGNCNIARVTAAEELAEWIATDPAETGIRSNLVIGDLNAYDHEDPIDTLGEAGYTDLVRADNGEHAYTYVFDGQVGYLDHALGDEALRYQVTRVAPWGINADEVDLLDYDMTFKPAWQDENLFAPDAYRSSDHDPVLVGLALDGTAPTLDVTLDRTTLWPPNHKYVTVTADVEAADDRGTAEWKLVSVTSSEPDDAPGSQDGATTKDIVIVDRTHVRLRAERSETGTGRVYTLTFRASDPAGNTTEITRTVTVPLIRR